MPKSWSFPTGLTTGSPARFAPQVRPPGFVRWRAARSYDYALKDGSISRTSRAR